MFAQERKNKIAKIASAILAIIIGVTIVSLLIHPWQIMTKHLAAKLRMYHMIVLMPSVLLFIIALLVTSATEKRRWLQGIISALIGTIIGFLVGIGWCMTAVGGAPEGFVFAMLRWNSIAGAIIGEMLFVEIIWIQRLVQDKSRIIKRLAIFFTTIIGLPVNVFLIYKLSMLLFYILSVRGI